MNRHRRPGLARRLAVATAVAVACTAAGTAAGGSYLSPAEQATDNIALGGCVIRFDTLNAARTRVVPRIHANAVHRCVGVAGVHVNTAGSLVVDFDAAADAVVSMMVGPDETFARWGIMCGPSVAAGSESVACYRDGARVRADSLKLYSHTSNLWLIMTWWRGP